MMVLAMLAVLGWGLALTLAALQRRRVKPFAKPTKALLVDVSGRPESLRTLHGDLPPTYTRPRKGKPSQVYAMGGVAQIYQATDER